jgi:hypothetical protein|tara:strand:- start:34 stop:249 length:216 start_codon:yes stop_codon:yes gene_type:complete
MCAVYTVVTICCRPIDQYTSADAAKYRDWLVEKGLARSSVKGAVNSNLESFEIAYLKVYSVVIKLGYGYET